MTLDEYQKEALKTAFDPKRKHELFHLVLGLVAETGEMAEKFQKWIRDHNSNEEKIDSKELSKELGDVLWYVAVLASFFDISLDQLAVGNINKLRDRQKRNVLGGSGDNR